MANRGGPPPEFLKITLKFVSFRVSEGMFLCKNVYNVFNFYKPTVNSGNYVLYFITLKNLGIIVVAK